MPSPVCSRHAHSSGVENDCLRLKATSVVASEIAAVPMSTLIRRCEELGLHCNANATKLYIANHVRNFAKDVVSKNTSNTCISAIAEIKSDLGYFSRFVLDNSNVSDTLTVPWCTEPVHCSELLATLDVMTSEELRNTLRNLEVKVGRQTRKSVLTYLTLDHFETVLQTYAEMSEDSLRDWLSTYLKHQPPLDFTRPELLIAIFDLVIPESALSALMSCPRNSAASTHKLLRGIQDMQRARLRGLRRRIYDGAVAHFWPQPVPEVVRLACMSDFHAASQFKPARCCAACARCRIDVNVDAIEFDRGKSEEGWTLESLRCEDEWLLSHPERPFRFRDPALNDLMLEPAGLSISASGKTVVNLCLQCKSAVRRGKIPKLSYRNGLFRGRLPEFLQDLSWVEEQVLALYRLGTNVTRLFGSSNPDLPFVLYGNTCAHPQNVVETAAVLPRTAGDVADTIGVIFVGPGKYKPKGLQTFRVRRGKLIAAAKWLRTCNKLFAEAPWDDSRFDEYPEDGCLPGIESRLVHTEVEDASGQFAKETAGLDPHPAVHEGPRRLEEDEEFVFMDALGITDTTADNVEAKTFEATALLNILPLTMRTPDVTLHRGSAAIPEYGNYRLFPGLFPTLFPYGIGGLEDWDAQESKQRVGFRLHAAYLLDSIDRRFSGHPSFMFVVVNILQRRAVHLETRFRIKSSRIESMAPELTSVTAEQIRRVAKQLEDNKSYASVAAEDKKVLDLLNLVEMVTVKVPGSHASKLNLRRKIFAMCRHFSVPQVYLTLNPSPLHSPLFQLMAGDHEIDLMQRYPKVGNAIRRSLSIAKDPAMAALFFELSTKLVFEHLLGWDFETGRSKPRGGLLGHMEAFAISNELTNRGVFHLHAVIWLKGGLNPREVRERIQEDDGFEKRFFAFWDEVIRHHLPDIDTVEQTSNPRQERPPQPPMWAPDIAGEGSDACVGELGDAQRAELEDWKSEFNNEVKRMGESVQRHRHKEVCTKYEFKGLCRFQFPHEVVEESHFDPSANAIVLKCLDPMVNYFNPEILVMCRHNHDIKCILSGRAAQAAIHYISNYITKLDVNTHQILGMMSDAVRLLEARPMEPGQTVDLRTMLHKCLARIIKTQQMHAQRAAALIRGSDDSLVSHTTVPMISGQLMKYTTSLYLTEGEVIEGCAHGSEEDEGEENDAGVGAGDALDAGSDTGDIVPEDIEEPDLDPALEIAMDETGRLTFGNQFDDYFHRPRILETVNFYEFAQRFRTVPLRTRGPGSKSGIRFEHSHPRASSHMLTPRTTDAGQEVAAELVPMSIGPAVPRKGENRYYKLYCLSHFKPFSCRQPLVEPGQTVETAFESFVFDSKARRRMDNWEALHECDDERDAERLRKQALKTAEKIVFEHNDDEDGETAFTVHHSAGPEKNYQKSTYAAWTALDAAGWFGGAAAGEQSRSDGFDYPDVSTKTKINKLVKGWRVETKVQEKNKTNAIATLPTAPRTTQAEDLIETGPRTLLTENRNTVPLTEELVHQMASRYELNAEQKRAFRVCTSWMTKHFEYQSRIGDGANTRPKPLRLILHGPGGTGKTHSLKPIQDILAAIGRPDAVVWVAPTGTAAALIDGMTLHAALKLKVKRKDSPTMEAFEVEWSAADRKQLDDLFGAAILVVLDEFSLASTALLGQLDTALRVAKQNWDEEFGGMSIIMSGDLCQYPPVKEKAVYIPMPEINDKTESRKKTPVSRLGRLAYLTFDQVIEFREQHRMRGDPVFGAAVTRLRTRECTQEDVEMFNTRVVKSIARPKGVDLNEPRFRAASIITVDNYTRNLLNEEKARALGGEDPSFRIIAADDVLSAGKASKKAGIRHLSKSMREKVLGVIQRGSDREFYPGKLFFYTDIPVVMKHKNVSVPMRVTNGAQGILRKIVFHIDQHGYAIADIAFVEFRASQLALPGLPRGVYPITPLSSTLAVPVLSLTTQKTTTLNISRRQLPIEAAFAVTGHSAQGRTVPEVICDPTARNPQSGFYTYVSISRARNLNSLAILQPILLENLNKPLTPHLKFELRRLGILAHNTAVRSGDTVGAILHVPVPEIERTSSKPTAVISSPTTNGTKRKQREDADQARKRARIADPVEAIPIAVIKPTSSPFWGPSWDSTNWSCAFDSVFCAVLASWLSMGKNGKDSWMREVSVAPQMAAHFEQILSMPNSTAHCNEARDLLKRYICERDPSVPMSGPVNSDITTVAQHCVRGDVNAFNLYFDAEAICRGCSKHLGMGEISLDLMIVPPRESANFTMNEWLHHGLARAAQGAVPMLDDCCNNTRFAISLDDPPPFIKFEVDHRLEVIPEEKLAFQRETGYIRYALGAVLYKTGQTNSEGHFSARFVWKSEIFGYDGMVAQGVPQHQGPFLHIGTSLARWGAASARRSSAVENDIRRRRAAHLGQNTTIGNLTHLRYLNDGLAYRQDIDKMVNIPVEVAKRLEELAACELTLQNPNFNADDLLYHEPDLPYGETGARRGTWSDEHEEFQVSLIGQLSLHQTFIGPYGDLMHRNPKKKTFDMSEICRAKTKVTIAIPHDSTDSAEVKTARRQFESLRAVEERNFASVTEDTHGIHKSNSFAFNGDRQWRAAAFSDFIFTTSADPASGRADIGQYDKSGIIAALPADKREMLKANPVGFWSSEAEPVPLEHVPRVFRPGVWVELSATLRVWAMPEKGPMHARRPATRSYQVTFDAIQHLADGRLDEGPLKTPPKTAPGKRKFKPVCTAGTQGPAKKIRFGDVEMSGSD